LHPVTGGEPMRAVEEFEVVVEQGIAGNPRYFNRRSRGTGAPSRRQVSLIEREQIAEHATVLGLESIAPGAVRSNIETTGIQLVPLVGHEVAVGEAVLRIELPRDPCAKMDAICQGLRELMMNDRQGVLATVIKSGKVRIGDPVCVLA
jgi:MOSC domain-containing protein YiiM